MNDDALGEGEHDDTVMGDDLAPPVPEPDIELNPNDPIPSAGAADIGGRRGDLD
jgi:hypothetical protein